MESDRMRQRAEELERLEQEKALHPELFPERVWADDNAALERLGIHIPGKSELPQGFLKLLPSDFIVEEVAQDGLQTSIAMSSAGMVDSEGETVYATLVKCGLSSLEAVDELAKLLGTTRDKIQYAGIKDKEAITSQLVSFRGIPKERVLSLESPHFFLKDVHTGKGVVQKGGLRGNTFTILIRIPGDMDDTGKVKRAVEALEKVKRDGFYNFFYLQRFGTPRLNNYKWAVLLMKGEYEKALLGLIGDPGLREIPYFTGLRKEIAALAPDWGAVLLRLKEFPLVFSSEIKAVSHLAEMEGDFVGALRRIEDQVSLWISALASLLYNRKVSAYLLAGMEPPKTLPLFTSPDKNDWLPYSDDLGNVGIFPPDFRHIRPFRTILITHREIETKDRAEIHGAEVLPEGIIITFTLGKGEYATTFLSHFVTLLNGVAPEGIGESVIDTKAILGNGDAAAALRYFAPLNIPRKDR